MNDKEHRNLERAGKADTDRILTIPNVLSFFRLALIPVIIVLYAKNEVWWAFGMLVLSGVTDVVDGWVARTYHMVSNFGKAIDPVADKLTQIAMLLCLLTRFPSLIILLALLLIKEITGGVMSLLILKRRKLVLPADWHGKLTTFLLYATMLLHLLWGSIPESVSNASIAVCSAVTLMSFVLYFIRNFRALSRSVGKSGAV